MIFLSFAIIQIALTFILSYLLSFQKGTLQMRHPTLCNFFPGLLFGSPVFQKCILKVPKMDPYETKLQTLN